MEVYLQRVRSLARFHRQLRIGPRDVTHMFSSRCLPLLGAIYTDAPNIASVPACPVLHESEAPALPELPEGLEIDRTSKLDMTVAPYDAHVIIRTGTSDWPSKIEDDERFPLVGTFKKLLGRGGKYANPFHNILVSTSDRASSWDESLQKRHSVVETYHPGESPSLLTDVEHVSGPGTEQFAEHIISEYLLPIRLSARAKQMIPSEQHRSFIRRQKAHDAEVQLDVARRVALDTLKVLICGHGCRDQRCGVYGPVLQIEFEKALKLGNGQPRPGSYESGLDGPAEDKFEVDLISHIGGHKFAGNVITYIPESGAWKNHPLAGMGIWYGRVEPKHVPGIVLETNRGRIIKELFRGGIDGKGGILRFANVESVVSSSDI